MMTAVTLRAEEGAPASGWADPAWAWQRVEAWLSHRWAARTIVWTVEGPGDWTSPLTPATITEVAEWRDLEWASISVDPSPLGGLTLPCGTFRVTATVGDDTAPPAAVQEAIARLVAYHDAAGKTAPYSAYRETVAQVTVETEQPSLNVARSLQQSGAADLLKPWRRLR